MQNMGECRTRIREVIYLQGENDGLVVMALVGFSIWEGDGSRDVLFATPALGAELVRKEIDPDFARLLAKTLH